MSGSLFFSLALLASPAQSPANDAVLEWNEAALQAIKASKTPPPFAARHLAILHIAMVDAITGVRHTCKPFEVEVTYPAGTSIEVSATTCRPSCIPTARGYFVQHAQSQAGSTWRG